MFFVLILVPLLVRLFLPLVFFVVLVPCLVLHIRILVPLLVMISAGEVGFSVLL